MLKRSTHYNLPKTSKQNAYFTIYSLLIKGYHLKEIAKELGIKKQGLNRYVSRLKNEGILKKSAMVLGKFLSLSKK